MDTNSYRKRIPTFIHSLACTEQLLYRNRSLDANLVQCGDIGAGAFRTAHSGMAYIRNVAVLMPEKVIKATSDRTTRQGLLLTLGR